MKDKRKTMIQIALIVLSFVAVIAISFSYFSVRQGKFNPPDLLNRTEGKNVEDYFTDKLGMTTKEAKDAAANGVSFYVTTNTTLNSIVDNLYYYGLIKDEKAFREALEQTKDITPGKANAIKVGVNGTIDIQAFYGLKKGLTAWQIADILLNQPTYLQGTEYNYMFMPGGLKSDQPTKRPTR